MAGVPRLYATRCDLTRVPTPGVHSGRAAVAAAGVRTQLLRRAARADRAASQRALPAAPLQLHGLRAEHSAVAERVPEAAHRRRGAQRSGRRLRGRGDGPRAGRGGGGRGRGGGGRGGGRRGQPAGRLLDAAAACRSTITLYTPAVTPSPLPPLTPAFASSTYIHMHYRCCRGEWSCRLRLPLRNC